MKRPVEFMGVYRVKGKCKNQFSKPIDEVYLECPECSGLVYDEGLPYDEFVHYCQTPTNNLVCDDCEAKGKVVMVYHTFRLTHVYDYIPEEKRAPFFRYCISSWAMGVPPTHEGFLWELKQQKIGGLSNE